MRLDDGEGWDMFEVGGSSAGVCTRATAVKHIFTAVLRVAGKRFIADAAVMDSMVQLQQKKNGKKKRGKTRAGKVDWASGGERRTICCGECCTSTMQALSHDHQEGWRGYDDDRDCVYGVRAHGLGGRDGVHGPANERWGEVPFIITAAGQMYK